MKAKTKHLEIGKDILGKEEEFLLISVEPCKKYDQVNQRTTDEIEGYRYTIFVDNPAKEIDCEKLEVKILGANQLPQYTTGQRLNCKFINLQLTISSVDFGKAEIKATADRIVLVDDVKQDEQPSKKQIKI